MTDKTGKLRFTTLALRRELPSDHHELAPLVAPTVLAYGPEDRTSLELSLAMSELPEEARPSTVARHLLPEGVKLEEIEVELGRGELPGRIGKPIPITVTVAVVPEPRAPMAGSQAPMAGSQANIAPAGHWVFIPAIDHACYLDRGEDLADRVQAELAVLPSARSLDSDGWKRLVTYAPTRIEPVAVELSTTPLAEAQGRKALADAERKRQAVAVLDGAGRRVTPPDPPTPLVGREELLAELTRILDGRTRRGMLLVGDEAAGKSALVVAWAQAHPERAMWTTSAVELIAGASGLGEWQARIASVLAAAETLDAILYFDDFGALFADRPAEGGVELPAAMRRHIVDGRVRVIGEVTAVALDRAERRDVSLIGSMLRLSVPPLEPKATVDACLGWAAYWAKTQPQRPQIAPVAIAPAVELARRYLPYRAFPGKAVRLLEELRVAHDAGRDARGAGKLLGESELYAAFSWSTGIPVALLADDKALAQTDVIAQLRRRMVGQDAAVRRVADAIAVAKARLQPADKPLASLFFVGPSGVGKTELARSLAAYLFGAPDRMVRLDMSEYTDPYATERLFGGDGPNGDEGRLTAAVRSQPFGVVLLDEIEKAHGSVFDLLLQVLGEARLTDGRGRTTYFHNSIIVLTSNLGTRSARGKLGISPAEDEGTREERRYRDAVLGAFRPELINRLDQIVVFHPLQPAEIARVADIAVARLAERRGFTQSGVILDISPSALATLADRGFSAELGARALRRHLDMTVMAPAARLLAKAGAEGHGGTLSVRTADELVIKPAGARLGEHAEAGVVVALWRRASATGRKLVRSALALGGLRRDTDRELALPAATGVRDKIGEIEATLATVASKAAQHRGTPDVTALPGPEIARLSQDHARLSARWAACVGAQAELRTAEELCLEALARDIDAIDLIDGAIAARDKFRRDLFWLLVALRPAGKGATLLVHTPDARAAVAAWVQMILGAAAHIGWRVSVHVWNEQVPGWKPSQHPGGGWGPPHDAKWFASAQPPVAALVRIAGTGADHLLGLEGGLHRFHGLAGEACHVWVDLLEPRALQIEELAPIAKKLGMKAYDDLLEDEWLALPGPPSPRAPRGTPMREVIVSGDDVIVDGEELAVPWRDCAARLPEVAVARVLPALAGIDALWTWDYPLRDVELQLRVAKQTEEE